MGIAFDSREEEEAFVSSLSNPEFRAEAEAIQEELRAELSQGMLDDVLTRLIVSVMKIRKVHPNMGACAIHDMALLIGLDHLTSDRGISEISRVWREKESKQMPHKGSKRGKLTGAGI
jgi:hypothetical protein